MWKATSCQHVQEEQGRATRPFLGSHSNHCQGKMATQNTARFSSGEQAWLTWLLDTQTTRLNSRLWKRYRTAKEASLPAVGGQNCAHFGVGRLWETESQTLLWTPRPPITPTQKSIKQQSVPCKPGNETILVHVAAYRLCCNRVHVACCILSGLQLQKIASLAYQWSSYGPTAGSRILQLRSVAKESPSG